jgi:RIO-like serine/threonine protein kinase
MEGLTRVEMDDDIELENMTGADVGMGLGKESNVWEGYNPGDYTNLNINKEVSDLFKYITE